MEHRWTIEDRWLRVGAVLDRREVRQSRIVCSCGFVTNWGQDWRRVHRAGTIHALDGQQSMTP